MSHITTFSDILLQISRDRRALNDHKKRTFEWYREQAKKIRTIAKNVPKVDVGPPKDFMDAHKDQLLRNRSINAKMIGKMLMYIYDPKTKAKLPYYDTFPLVFPIKMYDDGFLGINLHYLPPNSRAVLMGNLYSTLQSIGPEDKKLAITYEILKAASRFQLFKPCIKRYLYGHIRSKFLFVEPKQWDCCLMLPTANFQKATEQRVWNESMEQFRK